jgi:hypothetical protein
VAGPIKPEDVGRAKAESFPQAVFDAFNELITQKFVGNSATVYQDDVVKLMIEKGLSLKDIFDKGWLNVEDAYRVAGWEVEYDKPGFNETYQPIFMFKKK